MAKAKPFGIPKRWVWEVYQRVKVNRGAAGVDDQSIEAFDRDVTNNLFKLWNRLSSGSYFPPPARRVEIKKRGGGTRPLGVPTVSDRIAQGVVKAYLEPELERHFHSDSYGYRPGKSALEAVGVARQRCWRHDWVLDLDIQAFFDTIPHDLLLRAVRKHTDCKWVLLYVERWLQAPVQHEDGTLESREKGTPQGSVLSPLLSNVLLDDLDKELERRGHKFCRYADDANIYVKSKRAGDRVMASVTHFLEAKLHLRVNRDKSTVDRPWKRTFLGYTVTDQRRPRLKPAPSSIKRVKDRIREITHRGRGRNLQKVIEEISRYLRGWFGYFRLSSVKHHFELMDQWIRRRLRKILWEQWRKPKTRYRKLVALGIWADRARKAVATGRREPGGMPAPHTCMQPYPIGSWRNGGF